MKPRNTRKTVSELKRLCRKNGVEVEVILDDGKGSHCGILFRDMATGQEVKIVIPGHKEISPGVQRELLKYLAGIAVRIALAETVRAILHGLFG